MDQRNTVQWYAYTSVSILSFSYKKTLSTLCMMAYKTPLPYPTWNCNTMPYHLLFLKSTRLLKGHACTPSSLRLLLYHIPILPPCCPKGATFLITTPPGTSLFGENPPYPLQREWCYFLHFMPDACAFYKIPSILLVLSATSVSIMLTVRTFVESWMQYPIILTPTPIPFPPHQQCLIPYITEVHSIPLGSSAYPIYIEETSISAPCLSSNSYSPLWTLHQRICDPPHVRPVCQQIRDA